MPWRPSPPLSLTHRAWAFLRDDGNAKALGLLVVGVPALCASILFISERIWPEPDLVLVLPAKDFLRGEGVNTTAPFKCYEGLLLNEPPYKDQGNSVDYRIFFKRGGNYALLIEYSAAEPRPVAIKLNDDKVTDQALAKTTASEQKEFDGWCNNRTRWENVGVVAVKRGANLLRISRPGVFPHLKTIKFVREDA